MRGKSVRAPVSRVVGADAARRAIGAANCHPLSGAYAPSHQAAAAVSRPREQARVYVSR